jgi:hypothetical protein
MIVDLANKLVILGNRKCASSTFYNKFLGFTEIQAVFIGKPSAYSAIEYNGKEIKLLNYEASFFSQHYKHFNLQQALYFFDKIELDFTGFTFIIAIREPYSRCISEYKYYLKNSKNEAQLTERKARGINSFILSMPRLHENSLEYFGGTCEMDKKKINIEIVKVESLDSDLKVFFEKRSLLKYLKVFSKDILPRINNTEGLVLSEDDLTLAPLTKKYIFNLFRRDFEYGGYKI